MTTFFPPIIQAGPQGAGFAVSQRHGVVTGFYHFSPVGGDQLVVNVIMFRNARSIGADAIAIADAATSYTPFTVRVNYFSDEVPDACIIKMSIISPVTGCDAHQGSTMLVDDLSFSAVVSVGENKSVQSSLPEQFVLEQNYPNPFLSGAKSPALSGGNPETEIRFRIPEANHVVVRIFNTLGEEIRMLADAPFEAGYHSVRWDGKAENGQAVASGVYLCQLRAGRFMEVKKMSLLR